MGDVPAIGHRRMGRARWAVLLGAALCVAACACGADESSSDASHEVTRQVVSHETTQDILVFAPDEGSWPVVFAMHGRGGSGEDLAEIARRLAERGFVVFAPSYRTIDTARGDLLCALWYVRSIAGDHGGDLDQPMTFLGWSLAADYALEGALAEDVDPADQFPSCATEFPRADVVVAVAGCHYEVEGMTFDFDASGWSNKDATIVVAVGEDDANCEPWQAEDASDELRSNGYDVDFVVFDDADHVSPLFLDFIDGQLVLDPEHPAGDQLVDIVVDAVAGEAKNRTHAYRSARFTRTTRSGAPPLRFGDRSEIAVPGEAQYTMSSA